MLVPAAQILSHRERWLTQRDGVSPSKKSRDTAARFRVRCVRALSVSFAATSPGEGE